MADIVKVTCFGRIVQLVYSPVEYIGDVMSVVTPGDKDELAPLLGKRVLISTTFTVLDPEDKPLPEDGDEAARAQAWEEVKIKEETANDDEVPATPPFTESLAEREARREGQEET